MVISQGKKDFYVGTGSSTNSDAYEAGHEAVEQAIKVSKAVPDIGLVFCSAKSYAPDDPTIQKLADGAHDAFTHYNKNIKWIGCTTAGEISNYGSSEGSCVAMAISSKQFHAGLGIGRNAYKNPFKAGKEAALKSLHDIHMDKYIDPYVQFMAMKNKRIDELVRMNPYAFISFFPGTTKFKHLPADNIVKGFLDVTGTNTQLFAGSSADDFILRQTYQFANGKAYKDAVPTLSLISNFEMSFSSQHGYKPFGNIMFIDKAKNEIILLANHEQPLYAYSNILGVEPNYIIKNTYEVGMNHPIGIPREGGYNTVPVTIAMKGGHLVSTVSIPENSVVVPMKSTKHSLLNAARHTIENGKKRMKGKPALVLVTSCGYRKMKLGKDFPKETDILKARLGKVPFIGFYSYGQGITPSRSLSSQVNYTFSTFMVSDQLISK